VSSVQPRIETDDLIVLLLGGPSSSPLARDRIQGITRLEKLVFLLENESEIGRLLSEDPEFRAHNFGPFSSKIYQAVDTLAAAGLVDDTAVIADTTEDAWESEQVIGSMAADPYATRDVSLTDRGRRYYEALLKELPPGTEHELRQFKREFAEIPLRQLVRYVYERYPKMTEKSIIKRQILGR
jgi:hypothetical protein